MHGDAQPVLARLKQLLIIAEWFELPVVATLEKPLQKKGGFPKTLEPSFPSDGKRLAKDTYNLCADSAIRSVVTSLGCKQFAVAGAETDVCVLQSVLGLLQLGFTVFVLEDCLFSSEPDPNAALFRMVAAGAIPTTYKTLFYELRGTEDSSRWETQERRAIAKGFVPVESLPVRSTNGRLKR